MVNAFSAIILPPCSILSTFICNLQVVSEMFVKKWLLYKFSFYSVEFILVLKYRNLTLTHIYCGYIVCTTV